MSGGEANGDEVDAGDPLEVADVRRPQTPPGGDGGGGHETVVRTDVQPGRGEFSPQAGVRPCREQVEGQRGKRGDHRFDEGLAAGTVFWSGAVHAMKELGGGDGGYRRNQYGNRYLLR